ncbi:MAG: hypothetical protein K8S97_09700 [Anaerolineae bacterium]|nr:hypothetical protein [Anaerolineae bacterium]
MNRKTAFLVTLVVAISLLIVSMAAAAAVATSFEEFGPGTNGAGITVSGVTFGANCTVDTGWFSWNGGGDQMVLFNGGRDGIIIEPPVDASGPQMAPAAPGACKMTFTDPQSQISFDWASCDAPVTVTGYLSDVEVFSDVVTGTDPAGFDDWEGYYAHSGTFDEVHVNANCMALDHLSTHGTAGCDVNIPIPAGSVVGTFTADAATYWSPGNLTDPIVTISAGNTAWVLGLDASGAYYKIVWVCDYLWVPVSSMGPNYDAVWNGAPLPTGVVD